MSDVLSRHVQTIPSLDGIRAVSVLIVGEDELAKGKVILRDMATKRQEEIDLDHIEAELMARKAN